MTKVDMTGRLSTFRVLAMALAVVATAVGSGAAGQVAAPRPTGSAITLDVDASDAPLKILHATMSMPAKAGPMSLFYPSGFRASTWPPARSPT
ncbi:MAG: hypothetical protein ABIT71_22585 [Vicinamibacteraceae bacterium]